jgi:hypothetical protein
LPLLLLLPVMTHAADPVRRALRLAGGGGLAVAAADFPRAKGVLEAQPGPAICESLLLCFGAGNPLTTDPFNSYQAFTSGRADEAALLAAVANGSYQAIELRAPIVFRAEGAGGKTIDLEPPIRFTEGFYEAVAAHYRMAVANSAGAVYVPR